MKNTINYFKAKKLLAIILSFMLLVITNGCAKDNTPHDDIDWAFYNERAETLVKAMANDDFDVAAAMFDKAMAQRVGVPGLQDLWLKVNSQADEFINIHKTENIMENGRYRCFITSRHENSGVTLRVVFSKDGFITGLFVEDYPVITDEENSQAIIKNEGFTDFPIIIGEGTDFPLDGILSIPNNVTDKIPAVVIVHGSGSHDMDGTLFANMPYRDIAEYLAANGIAVLRYDKRTFTHGAKMEGHWTVREEVIEDTLLATEILKAHPNIDERRVFIAGHSLGGMLAPRIHAEGGNYAGLILLAGSPRSLLEISREQIIALINDTMEGEEKENALTQFQEMSDMQIRQLMDTPDDIAKNTLAPEWGGVSLYYLKDMHTNPSSDYIPNITAPFLVLQGSNDLQILAGIDFAMYQELLAGRSNATLKLYDGLNHLFMPSTIKSVTEIMDEYAIENKVDIQVLADIVGWIKTH